MKEHAPVISGGVGDNCGLDNCIVTHSPDTFKPIHAYALTVLERIQAMNAGG